MQILLIALLLGMALHVTLVEAASGELGHSISLDNASTELIIGVGDMPSKSYIELMVLIAKYGGAVLNYVSFKDHAEAGVVSLPLLSAFSFVREAEAVTTPSYVESNIRFKIDVVPNDPYWSVQWAPRKIEADYAWNTTFGNSSVLVAVIDTGVDWNHPDLAANYAPLGYDWVNNDNNPMDDHGHGTHVAGIIAAVTNNGIGVAGISQVRIMAEKGLDQNGYGYADDLANAIVHAADQGANTLSMSWGDYANSVLIQRAIRYAYDSGALLVAAAGNDGTSQKMYPAAYNEVIAVSATDQLDNPAWFTNYGNWIELAAPGVDIFSTIWDNDYGYKSGTSMAAPHVSGVAALIMSRFPEITRDQVRAQLRNSSDDLGAVGFDPYYGYGRINAQKAVETSLLKHDIALTSVSARKSVVGQGFNVKIDVNVTNRGDVTETFNVTVYANATAIQARLLTLSGGNFSLLTFTWNTTGFAKGNYLIDAYASPVPNEINATDNTFHDGSMIVAMVGDITGPYGRPDSKVDIRDIAIVAKAYGTYEGYQNWNPNADINDDELVDIKDVSIVAKNYGKIDP